MKKYKLTFKTDAGEKQVVNRSNSLPELFNEQMELSMLLTRELMKENGEVKLYYTSDERYPDAWGYANNGIELQSNSRWYLYIIEEA